MISHVIKSKIKTANCISYIYHDISLLPIHVLVELDISGPIQEKEEIWEKAAEVPVSY